MIHITSFKLLPKVIKEDLVNRNKLDFPPQNLCWDCHHVGIGESGTGNCEITQKRVSRNETCPEYSCKRVLYPEYVYVGRAMPRYGLKASPLANPFKPSKNKSIYMCLDLYKLRLKNAIDGLFLHNDIETKMRVELENIILLKEQLKDIFLICWCKKAMDDDTPCHGDCLKEILEGMKQE